jgi:hypothetical protein
MSTNDGLSGEKKRLEQFLLQSKASNIVMVDPRYGRFQPDKIDTIRLRTAQIEAGKKPVSEKLVKEQKKKKTKARRPKQLRGEVGRAILEQKRFERGERRDKPEQEPRIIGEPINTGLSYDPDIERRRLDIQEQINRDANLRALMDRRAALTRQEQELAVRRGELVAGRAERRAERERLAAAAPVINIPQAIADPIPEIERLGALIRQDVNAFGAEQRAVNQDVLSQVRRQARRQAELEQRQVVIDDEQRQLRLAQDANLEEIQSRLGMTETSMGRARDAVIQEIRDAETRLTRARGELDQPTGFDDVILREANRRIDEDSTIGARRIQIEEVDSPTPELREPEPEEPTGIEGVIAGGGPLELPNIVVERPGNIGPDQSLRLSPEQQARIYTRGTAGPVQKKRGEGEAIRGEGEAIREEELSPLTSEASSLGIPAERLTRGGGRGTGQFSSETSETSESELQFRLEPHDPIDVASVLRLEEVRPLSTADLRLSRRERAVLRSPVREEVIGSPSSARAGPLTPATREEEQLLEEVRQLDQPPAGLVSQRIRALESIEAGNPRPIATERVIEDSGIVALPAGRVEEVEIPGTPPDQPAQQGREIRELDPDEIFDVVEEAEEVGQIQDQRPQATRDSATLYYDVIPELAGNVRTGPRGPQQQPEEGQESTRVLGLGYRVRNNTDRTLKKVQPGDVVNIIGVEGGDRGEGRFRLDTETRAGTRVSADQLGPLIEEGSFLFERGHRHELGGHFDREPYGPPPEEPLLQEELGE